MSSRRSAVLPLLLALLLALLLPAAMLVGSVDIPASDVWAAVSGGETSAVRRLIVMETRLPAVLTSVVAGASLAVAGLLMQTCFNNPLAGPSIMGVSSGASLGVGAVMLLLGGMAVGAWGRVAVVGGAFVGALAVMLLLLAFASVIRSAETLLIIGVLIGYLASSGISMMNFFASAESVHGYVMWGMGTFTGVPSDTLPAFSLASAAGILLSFLLVKPMDAMLLGERYAASVGVDVKRARLALMLVSGALTALVTAWCGPIAFIGLSVPHIARMLSGSSAHGRLLPVTALSGALLGLLCQIGSALPAMLSGQGSVMPVNALTPLVGVPVIVYVMLRRRRLPYFN